MIIGFLGVVQGRGVFRGEHGDILVFYNFSGLQLFIYLSPWGHWGISGRGCVYGAIYFFGSLGVLCIWTGVLGLWCDGWLEWCDFSVYYFSGIVAIYSVGYWGGSGQTGVQG